MKLEHAARQLVTNWDSGLTIHNELDALREALAEPQITTPDVCGEVCARAKLCYGCNKDLEEANAKYAEQAEGVIVKTCPDGYGTITTEQAEQEPVSKALLLATDALVYHTEQTRPIQKTDEAIIYLRNVVAQGVSSMAFTLEDAMAKYPEISYWHNEFLKHNTTAEQAEQEPVATVVDESEEQTNTMSWILSLPLPVGTKLYAAPVRTKDLTDDAIDDIALESGGDLSGNSLVWFSFHDYYKFARAVIAADREKNK